MANDKETKEDRNKINDVIDGKRKQINRTITVNGKTFSYVMKHGSEKE